MANQIVEWIRRCKRNRFAPLGLITTLAPELNLHGLGMKSIRTAVKSLGHGRRKAKMKGYSNRPENRRLRREFANEGILMSREGVYSMMFSDEVWVNGGLNAPSNATVLVSGDSHAVQMDRYHADCSAQKQDRLPGWMFHGVIYNGRKALGTFWEKNWGTVNSGRYDRHILPQVEAYLSEERANGRTPIFQHDNAPAHKSEETRVNLQRRQIPTLRWPPYPPDLNPIEHVWSWMKRFIQLNHSTVNYDPSRIPLQELRWIVQQA
ncbi:hypothetical protein K3495_g1318 [Podosphaera aphanis]|nr:hypothetical protein K3495_g1318 [Podosphaera aphanis]